MNPRVLVLKRDYFSRGSNGDSPAGIAAKCARRVGRGRRWLPSSRVQVLTDDYLAGAAEVTARAGDGDGGAVLEVDAGNRPHGLGVASSARALRFARSPNAWASLRPAMTAMATAEVHSRGPRAGSRRSSRAAMPAPACTGTIPDSTIAAGRASRPRSVTPSKRGSAASGRPAARVSCSWWPASAVVLSFILLAGHCTPAAASSQGQRAASPASMFGISEKVASVSPPSSWRLPGPAAMAECR